MRWLVNYLRMALCKHEWVIKEYPFQSRSDFGGFKMGIKVARHCPKCGWVRRGVWKF